MDGTGKTLKTFQNLCILTLTSMKHNIPGMLFGENIDYCGTFLESSHDLFKRKKKKNIKNQIYSGELEVPVTYFFY